MEKKNRGLTLLEILVTLAVISIIATAIALFYKVQVKTEKKQALMNELYQNGRTALYFIENELRMAGYSPNRNETWAAAANALNTGISVPGSTSVTFTYIADNDGYDNDNDGTIDNRDEISTVSFSLSGQNLLRTTTIASATINQVLASNIENLGFTYNTNAATNETNVGISILARTSHEMPGSTNTGPLTYMPLSGTPWVINTDLKHGRRLFTTSVNCRNTGI